MRGGVKSLCLLVRNLPSCATNEMNEKERGRRRKGRRKRKKEDRTQSWLDRISSDGVSGLIGYGRGIPEDFLSSILVGLVGFEMG